MRKEKSNVEINKIFNMSPMRMAVVLTLLFSLMILMVFTPYNETNDDKYMQDILSGAFGLSSSHIVFENIFFAKIIHIIYNLVPGYNWYFLIQLAIVTLAFIGISNVLIENQGQFGIAISIVIMLFYGMQFYLIINFGRISAVAAVGGYCYLISYLNNKKRYSLILGYFLILMSSFIRFKMFVLVSGFAFFCILGKLLYDNDISKCFNKRVSKYMILFVPILMMIFLLEFANAFASSRSKEWSEYDERRQAEAYVYMYGWPDYDTYRVIYDKYNITRVDYNLYKANLMADDSFLSTTALKELGKITKSNIISKIGINSFSEFVKYNGYSSYFILIIITLILVFLTKTYYFSLVQLVYFLGINYYLFLYDRQVDRVVIPLIFALQIFLIASIKHEHVLNLGKARGVVCIVLLVFVTINIFMSDYYILQRQQKDAESYYDLFKDKSNIYVVDHNVDGRKYQYQDAFTYDERGSFSNLLLYGGWLSGSPVENYQLKALGINNISNEMLYRDNIFFCTVERTKIVKDYLSFHYSSRSVTASVYDKTSVCNVISYNTDYGSYNERDIIGYSVNLSEDVTGAYEIRVEIGNDDAEILLDKTIYLKAKSKVMNDENLVFRAYKDEIVDANGIKNIIFVIPSYEYNLVDINTLGLYYR